MSNPQTDVEARLRQLKEEIDAILDGQSARVVDGRTAGELSDLTGVVFGLYGEQADVRATQEPVTEPPAPQICLLGEYLDALSATSGQPPLQLAQHAIGVMERSKRSEQYGRSASTSTEER